MAKFKVGDHIVSLDGSTELIVQSVGKYKYSMIVKKDDCYLLTHAKFPNELIDAIDPEYVLKK